MLKNFKINEKDGLPMMVSKIERKHMNDGE